MRVLIKHPNQVVSRVGPFLWTGFVIAQNEVGDVYDGVMLPADKHDAVSGNCILYEFFFFPLRVFQVDLQAQGFRDRVNRVERALAENVSGWGRRENGVRLCQGRMGELPVQRSEETHEGAGALPA